MIRKNKLIGAKAKVSTAVTVIATMISAQACRTDSRAPKTRLNRYSVGRQIARVTRNSSGSLTVETSACSQPLEAPSTAPYAARLIAEASSIRRISLGRSRSAMIWSQIPARSRRMRSMMSCLPEAMVPPSPDRLP